MVRAKRVAGQKGAARRACVCVCVEPRPGLAARPFPPVRTVASPAEDEDWELVGEAEGGGAPHSPAATAGSLSAKLEAHFPRAAINFTVNGAAVSVDPNGIDPRTVLAEYLGTPLG